MRDGVRLDDLMPRCHYFDLAKEPGNKPNIVSPGGVLVSRRGWPVPDDGETVLGRWGTEVVSFDVDQIADPRGKSYVGNGKMAALITDKSLRCVVWEDPVNLRALRMQRRILGIYWPYDGMDGLKVVADARSLRPLLLIQGGGGDSSMAIGTALPTKNAGDDDFLPGVFSAKNRIDEFAQALSEAGAAYMATVGDVAAGAAPDSPPAATAPPTAPAAQPAPPATRSISLGVGIKNAKGGGVQLRGVNQGGLADRAGLIKGDVIVTIGTQEVRDEDALLSALKSVPNLPALPIGVIRNGQRQQVDMQMP